MNEVTAVICYLSTLSFSNCRNRMTQLKVQLLPFDQVAKSEINGVKMTNDLRQIKIAHDSTVTCGLVF